MSTTIDDDVTTETPPKPTKRQRQAANIADAASGGIKMFVRYFDQISKLSE